ncbi:MAG: lipopolysaccharide biosynthesis protein [Anaerolineales bacterium]
MTDVSYAQSAVRGTLWTYASYYSGKIIVFLSTILLANLLTKKDFGVVGFALMVIGFLDVLSDLGIGPAVVYERENPRAGSTAFWINLGMSAALFALAWLSAPLTVYFFEDPRAVDVLRALALTFPITAFSNIHANLLTKALQFRRKFIPDFARAVAKGLFSVLFALLGFGIWSLVWGQIFGTLATVLAYWAVFPWRPRLEFDPAIARRLLNFGKNVVAVDGLASILLNLDFLFVGTFLGSEALGVYSLAFRLPDLLITQFATSVSSVLFPIYVKMREQADSLGRGFLTTLRYVSMVTIALGVGLLLVADSFVHAFLSAQWVEAIPVIQAIALYAMFFSLAYNAGSLYKATGKPHILTQLALVRLALLAPTLYVASALMGNIRAVGYGHALVALISGLLNLIVAARIAGVRFLDVLDALRPAAFSGLGMALAVWGIGNFSAGWPPLLQLIVFSLAGGAVYLALLLAQQPELFPTLRRLAFSARGRI